MSESIKDKLDATLKPHEAMLIEAFGDKKRYEHEKAFATLLMVDNKALIACSPGSIITALVNVAHCGTTLDPTMGLAYLIPRKQKRADPIAECKLDISYKGMVGIVVDSGSVMDIDASVVREGDEFDYEMGLNPLLQHRPAGQPNLARDRGKITHVYAIAYLLNGIKKFVVLSAEDVEKVRKKSNRPDSLMWTDFEDTGHKKCAIKRLYTLLPKTKQTSYAVMVVNQSDGGIDFAKHQPVKSAADVEYEAPEFGPPEIVAELNALFDALGINQAEREMQMGECDGDIECLKALEIELFRQKEDKDTKAASTEKETEKKADIEITPGNLKKVQTLFHNLGVKDRVERLKRLAKLVGRAVGTTNDLTDGESEKIIEELKKDLEIKEAKETAI